MNERKPSQPSERENIEAEKESIKLLIEKIKKNEHLGNRDLSLFRSLYEKIVTPLEVPFDGYNEQNSEILNNSDEELGKWKNFLSSEAYDYLKKNIHTFTPKSGPNYYPKEKDFPVDQPDEVDYGGKMLNVLPLKSPGFVGVTVSIEEFPDCWIEKYLANVSDLVEYPDGSHSQENVGATDRYTIFKKLSPEEKEEAIDAIGKYYKL